MLKAARGHVRCQWLKGIDILVTLTDSVSKELTATALYGLCPSGQDSRFVLLRGATTFSFGIQSMVSSVIGVTGNVGIEGRLNL